MSNPFFHGGRVDPAHFVGRRSELNQIFTALDITQSGQLQSISIVGPRRIGKSSLLFYIEQKYGQYLPRAEIYRFACIDLQDAHCHTLPGLLGLILHTLGVDSPAIHDQPLIKFQDAIQALKAQGILPVICLDEFEALTRHKDQFSFEFYESWRFLMNQNALSFITASKQPLNELAKTFGQTSAFFNIFTVLNLGELSAEAARQLIARGADSDHPFTTREQDALLVLAGRHPYKLQVAGSLLYQAKAKGGRVSWPKLSRDFNRQLMNAGLKHPAPPRRKMLIRPLLQTPESIGRVVLEGILRLKKDDISPSTAWITGAVFIVILILILRGVISISSEEILKLLQTLLGH